MAFWSNFRGVMAALFGIGGPTGVNLKHNAGVLQVRNAADTGYATLHCYRVQYNHNVAAGRIPISDASGILTLTDPGASGGAAQHYAGDVKYSHQAATHGKWLLCDGSAVSRTTYATLFALIGTTYGVGDGSTTFNLPNPQNRFLLTRNSGMSVGQTGGDSTPRTLVQDNLPVDTFISAGTSRVQVTTSGTTAFIQRKSTAATSIDIVPLYWALNAFIYAG